MLEILQILTISGMIGATFLVYQALGPRRRTFTYTREEKKAWDRFASGTLGDWLTSCNIFASITSLATVYVFFIGNTRKFGWWILFPIITIWAGAFVTNYLTRRLIARPGVAAKLAAGEQSAGVILTLFLDGAKSGVRAAAIARSVTIINILAILWMEFSVFADLSSQMIWSGSVCGGAILIFVCSFAVIYFTIRYGLRGFVFADLFQCPLMAIASLSLLIATMVVVGARVYEYTNDQNLISALFAQFSAPKVTWVEGGVFALSCVFFNSFFVVVTQPHWLRVWMFGEKEIRLQVRSLSMTCVVWLLLVLVGGLAAVMLSDTATGAETNTAINVVLDFLRRLNEISPLFAVAFWVAGMAALFSIARNQMYSLFLIRYFDPEKETPNDHPSGFSRPAVPSAFAAAVFALIYFFVRHVDIPFDSLVVVLLPLCLNIVPGLVLAARGKPQAPMLLVASLILYAACALLGLASGESLLYVGAPLMPMILSVVAAFYEAKETEHVRSFSQL
jgi:hypothetical protein